MEKRPNTKAPKEIQTIFNRNIEKKDKKPYLNKEKEETKQETHKSIH